MSIINRSSLANSYDKSFVALFWQAMGERDTDPGVLSLFEVKQTELPSEKYGEVIGLGMPVAKPEGSPITYDTIYQGYPVTLTVTTFGLGVQATHEALQDEINKAGGGFLSDLPKMLVDNMKMNPRYLAAGVFNHATSGSYLGGDGQPLASDSHPRAVGVGGSVFDNLGTAATLSETSLSAMLLMGQTLTDDRGIPLMKDFNNLVYGPSLTNLVWKVLNTPQVMGGNNNDLNVIKGKYNLKPLCDKFITSTTGYALVADKGKNGLVFMERQKPDLMKDTSVDTRNVAFNSISRHSVGFRGWRGVIYNAG